MKKIKPCGSYKIDWKKEERMYRTFCKKLPIKWI